MRHVIRTPGGTPPALLDPIITWPGSTRFGEQPWALLSVSEASLCCKCSNRTRSNVISTSFLWAAPASGRLIWRVLPEYSLEAHPPPVSDARQPGNAEGTITAWSVRVPRNGATPVAAAASSSSSSSMPVKRERPAAASAKPNKRAKLSSYRGVSQNKGRWVGQVTP